MFCVTDNGGALCFPRAQVRSRRNGQILAMKCISKQMLARRNHVAYMKTERDIMTKVSRLFVLTRPHSGARRLRKTFEKILHRVGLRTVYPMV